MTDTNSPKTNKTILNNLQSGNQEMVLKTIEQLKESGNIDYLPALFDTLNQSKSDEIKRAISGLLAELKQSDVVPLLVDAINNKKYEGIQNSLVAACWENGLDYSQHFSTFVDLILEKDFITAFEAHTVIMNMSGRISQEMADIEIKKIHAAMDVAGDKKQLLSDLLGFIPVFVQGIEPQEF